MQILQRHVVAVVLVLVVFLRVVQVVRLLLGKAVAEAEGMLRALQLHRAMRHRSLLAMRPQLRAHAAMGEAQCKFKQTSGNWLTRKELR